MQSSDIPVKSPRVFAQDASASYARSIPQTTGDPGAASFSQGFPPQTFVDESAGGTPPDGRDFNGILLAISAWSRWQAAGGPIFYDAGFQTSIGGYPLGAIVQAPTAPGFGWCSATENNMTNPTTGGAGWVPLIAGRASNAEILGGLEDRRSVSPKGLRDTGFDPIVAQNLADNNGYRISQSGFKEAWGYNNAMAPGATWSVSFASFMPPGQAFSVFQRLTLGSAVPTSGSANVSVGIIDTTLSGFTLRNSGSISASVQWSTRGV